MLLIEADGKALLAAQGIAVPAATLVTGDLPPLPGAGPWMVKAQVPVGGRGKAGGIVRCATPPEVAAATARMLGTRLKGHQVDACLVEQVVTGREHYLAVMVEPASYGLRVIYSSHGGIEIEQSASAQGRLCPPHAGAVAECLAELTANDPAAPQLNAIGRTMGEMLLQRELALVEVNPLFVSESGCLAGDAKIVVDLNAIDRQPLLAAMIRERPAIYLDANRKLTEGFDYVELDPAGEIGLVTTGAGLSMMLIDELTARGARPLNFCDIRTGQMRGSPARLIRVLQWIASGTALKVVLVNIFAGITDLAEFATLLATALEQANLTVPVVARLVGRNAAQAEQILAARQPAMLVTQDLETALSAIDAIVRRAS